MTPPPRILLAEDDAALRTGVRDALLAESYEVTAVADGRAALQQLKSGSYDLAILDVSMPEMNGFEVCRDARGAGVASAILFLTVRADEVDRVLGLELGADDYVTKPFSLRELRARVAAILRRSRATRAKGNGDATGAPAVVPTRVTIGNCEIDFDGLLVTRGKKQFNLPPKEAGMLKMLIQNEGRVVSREEVLKSVWGSALFVGPRTVDTHMGRIRAKIEEDPNNPRHLVTAHGVGYKFVRDIL